MVLRSFRRRLLLLTHVWILLALCACGTALHSIFHAQVADLFEEELKGHYDELIGLTQIDSAGQPALRGSLNDPRFVPLYSGFYWQIEAPQRILVRSESLGTGEITTSGEVHGSSGFTKGRGPNGPVLVYAGLHRPTGSSSELQIAIAAETRLLDDVVSRSDRTLALTLVLLGLGLAASAWASVMFGLRPLKMLQQSLAEIRAGRTNRMPTDLPSEIVPLAEDLNALLTANSTMVVRARAQAGTMAHSLKTPLAILMQEGNRLQATGQAEVGRSIIKLCERMQRQIDYQLASARSAGVRSRSPGSAASVAAAARSVVSALSRLYADQKLEFELLGDLDAVTACNALDLEEMLANLIDNAAKWARSRIRLVVQAAAPDMIVIRVEDDGPGIPETARKSVFQAGTRLDERLPGSGLGLFIVKDIAASYGGSVWIGESDLGGSAVCLQLPQAPID